MEYYPHIVGILYAFVSFSFIIYKINTGRKVVNDYLNVYISTVINEKYM